MRKNKKFRNIIRLCFLEYVDRGDNGIIGPGYHNFSYYKLSLSKISIYVSIIVGLLILIKL